MKSIAAVAAVLWCGCSTPAAHDGEIAKTARGRAFFKLIGCESLKYRLVSPEIGCTGLVTPASGTWQLDETGHG